MTLEQLQQANEIHGKIENVKAQLSQVTTMLDETKESTVPTRVRGMNFDLPKAIFKGELTKQKKDLEDELSSLESQFSAL